MQVAPTFIQSMLYAQDAADSVTFTYEDFKILEAFAADPKGFLNQ